MLGRVSVVHVDDDHGAVSGEQVRDDARARRVFGGQGAQEKAAAVEVDVDGKRGGGGEGGWAVAPGFYGGVAGWDGECLDGDLGCEVWLIRQFFI